MVDSISTNQYIQMNFSKNEVCNNLLSDLIEKSIRMCERKYTKKIEDLHNDDFTDWLRDKGYYVADQTRSGRSLLTAGEIDIMVRNEKGTPLSIIEAFRLSSCGKNNTTTVTHINKLLNSYDTIGHDENFILVYSEASDFDRLWLNYTDYVSNINGNNLFNPKSKLASFEDVSLQYSNKSGIRIGLAKHERDGREIKVYHIFINMHID